MRLFGEGLCCDGRRIRKNKRYVEADYQVYIEEALPEGHQYSIFGYDLYCGILQIHTTDINKVYPYKYWHVEEHYHDFYELHIIPRGKGRIILDGVAFDVGPGQFYLTGPYVRHEQFSDENDPMEEYCIQFSIKISDSASSEYPDYQAELDAYRDILGASYPRAFHDHLGLHKTYDLIFQEVEKARIAYEQRIHTLVTEILINTMRTIQLAISRTPKKAADEDELNRRAAVIRTFVAANYPEKISIHDLAGVLFLSAKQINRIVQSCEGMTFQTYLQKHRYQVAKELIMNTTLPLGEIAQRVGVSGESHLHKLFKKFDPASPGSYRK